MREIFKHPQAPLGVTHVVPINNPNLTHNLCTFFEFQSHAHSEVSFLILFILVITVYVVQKMVDSQNVYSMSLIEAKSLTPLRFTWIQLCLKIVNERDI